MTRCVCRNACGIDHGFGCSRVMAKSGDDALCSACRAAVQAKSKHLKPKRTRTSPRLNDSTVGLPLFDKVKP